MVKDNQIARGVRVVLNETFNIKSISDKFLKEELVLFIDDNHIYNDTKGKYVFIKGGSHLNSGMAYLDEIDLEYPFETPLYNFNAERVGDVNGHEEYRLKELRRILNKNNEYKTN